MNYHIIFDSSYEAFGFSLDALLSIIDIGGAAFFVGEGLSKRKANITLLTLLGSSKTRKWLYNPRLRRLRFLENRRYCSRVLLEIILNIILKFPIIF